MGFYWRERGYLLVDGPSGAGGHAANAAGFDGVAFNVDCLPTCSAARFRPHCRVRRERPRVRAKD